MNAYIQYMVLTSDFHSPLRFFFSGGDQLSSRWSHAIFWGYLLDSLSTRLMNPGCIRRAYHDLQSNLGFIIATIQMSSKHLSSFICWLMIMPTDNRTCSCHLARGVWGWDLYICRMAPWRWESLKHGDVGCHSSMAPVVKWNPKIRGLFWG